MPQQLVPYWNALKRWWWLIVICIGLAGVSAYAYWKAQPPVYQARIALSVGSSARSVNPNPTQLGIERSLATFYGEMVKRQPITQPVIERLGLNLSPEALGASIETRVIIEAQILEIYVYNRDPDQAGVIATGLAEELIRQSPATAANSDNQQFVQQQVADLQRRIADIDAQLVDLHNRMATMTSASDLAEAQASARELETLRQSYSMTYAQYLSVLNSQTVNQLSIIERANVPNTPVSTGLVTTLIIAMAGGLALSLGAIILLEYADDVMRWTDASFVLSLPVLGAVPRWTDREHPLILASHPRSAEADTVRSLRARINLGDAGSGLRKIAVTSPSPHDGKTFAALNLAVAAAAAGLRTVLVDGDMRLGNLHVLLDCVPEPGLSDLLRYIGRAHAASENVIKTTAVDNLYLVPVGRPVLDPASLLSVTKLDALANVLLAEADLVIIDTPPVGVGPDAALLAAASDAVILVVAADHTRRRAAIKAITELERYNLLGLVFNRVRLSNARGHYNRYYSPPVPGASWMSRVKRLPSSIRERFHRAPQRAPVETIASPRPDENAALPAGNGRETVAASSAASSSETVGLQTMTQRLWEAVELADRDNTIILTTAEAAERLDTTEEIVRGWCAAGRLPAVRIGKQSASKRP